MSIAEEMAETEMPVMKLDAVSFFVFYFGKLLNLH